MNKKNTNWEIDKTMAAFRDLDPIDVSDSFVNRVEHQIQTSGRMVDRPVPLWKLSLASAMLILILALNVTVLFSAIRAESVQAANTRKQALSVLMNDYAIGTGTIEYQID